MANAKADLAAAVANTPPTKVETQRLHGRIRHFEANITIAIAVAIGETITWGDLPAGARPIPHLGKLYFGAGGLGATINLGDAVNPARHLAATSVAAAGSAIPEAAALNGAQFKVARTSGANNDGTLVSVVAGAAVPVGQVFTLKMPYVMD